MRIRAWLVLVCAGIGLMVYGLIPTHHTAPVPTHTTIVQCVPNCSVHAYMAHLEAGVHKQAKAYTCKPVHAHTVPTSLIVRQAYGRDTLTVRRMSFDKAWNTNHDNALFNDVIVVKPCK